MNREAPSFVSDGVSPVPDRGNHMRCFWVSVLALLLAGCMPSARVFVSPLSPLIFDSPPNIAPDGIFDTPLYGANGVMTAAGRAYQVQVTGETQ